MTGLQPPPTHTHTHIHTNMPACIWQLTTELPNDLVAKLVRTCEAICQVAGLSPSLSHSFSSISHLSFSMTLTMLRSDCQVWSMFTTKLALLHTHRTPTCTHTQTHTVYTYLPCAYPTVFVPYDTIGDKLCTPSSLGVTGNTE